VVDQAAKLTANRWRWTGPLNRSSVGTVVSLSLGQGQCRTSDEGPRPFVEVTWAVRKRSLLAHRRIGRAHG